MGGLCWHERPACYARHCPGRSSAYTQPTLCVINNSKAERACRAVVVPTSIFMTNRRGYPTLSRRHQDFLGEMFQRGVQVGWGGWLFRLVGCEQGGWEGWFTSCATGVAGRASGSVQPRRVPLRKWQRMARGQLQCVARLAKPPVRLPGCLLRAGARQSLLGFRLPHKASNESI